MMCKRTCPCRDKNCSWCCDPVKLPIHFPESKIPTDEQGQPIWKKRDKILFSHEHPDTIRIKTYNCINFDKETGLCKKYDERPQIYKNSGCIDETSQESIDEQHKRVVEQGFL